ncbi:MAG: hypothetical protein VYE53_12045, partial [Planctomycetota bacterium]|nr:hypothetical protein [Planctomycetota bacterium]
MIELSCPHCGKKHKLHEDSSGQRVACQACGKQYKVPGVAKRHKPSSTEPKQTHPARSNPPPEHSSKTQGFQAADSSRQKNVLLGPGDEKTSEADLQSADDSDAGSAPVSKPQPRVTSDASAVIEEVAQDLREDEWSEAPEEVVSSDDAKEGVTSSLVSPPLEVDDFEAGTPADAANDSGWRGDADVASTSKRQAPVTNQGEELETDGVDEPLPFDIEDHITSAKASGDEIRVQCSICDSVTWVKSSKAGKTIACTDCGSEVPVPEGTATVRPSISDLPQSKSEKPEGWRLSQPINRPPRELPASLTGNSETTPSNFHVPKIQRWGDPEIQPELETAPESPGSFRQTSQSNDRSNDGKKVSAEPVGGTEQSEWNEPKVFGVVDWLRDTVVIFRNVTMYGAAIAIAFTCGAFGTVAKLALWYSGSDNEAVFRILGMCSMLFSLPCLFAAGTILSAVLMTMIQDGASNTKEIGNWPEILPSELFSHCAPMYVTGFISVVPGLVLAEFIQVAGLGYWGFMVFPLLSGFAMLPPMVISAFREQSMFSIYSAPVYQSVSDFSSEWFNFFMLTLGGLMVALMCMVGVGITPLFFDIPFWLVIGMLWVVYGRWVGILARRLAWLIPSNQEPAAQDEAKS